MVGRGTRKAAAQEPVLPSRNLYRTKTGTLLDTFRWNTHFLLFSLQRFKEVGGPKAKIVFVTFVGVT